MMRRYRAVELRSTLAVVLALLAVGLVWLVANVPVTRADPITIYVATTGENDSDCGTDADPCLTIPYAVTKAMAHDTVLVRPGTYLEPVTMKAGVIISGTGAANTIIDGENARGPLVIATGSTITRSAVLRGFTITRGYVALRGAGAYIGNGASPTLESCIVRDSQAGFCGGGAYIESASPLISGTHVLDNSSARGGGICLYTNVSPTFIDVEVAGNRATGTASGDGGGGLYLRASAPLFLNSRVLNNTAQRDGGGVYAFGSLNLASLRVAGNSSLSSGGGLYVGGSAVITGNEVSDNSAVGNGGGFYIVGTVTLTGTAVLSNTGGTNGGGVYAATVVLTNAQVISNTGGGAGGGVYQFGTSGRVNVAGSWFERNVARTLVGGALHASGSAAVRDTQFISNTAGTYGGGLSLANSAIVNRCRFVGNRAAERAGGFYGAAGVEATNSLFQGNDAPEGADIHLRGSSGTQTLRHLTLTSGALASSPAVHIFGGTVGMVNTIVASHTVGIMQAGGVLNEDYNLYFGNGTDIVQAGGTLNPGAHSQHGQDPAFIDPAEGDYHIGTGSAALDLGAFFGVLDDLDGDARPTDAAQPDAPDAGCDENKSLTVQRPVAGTMTFGAACARIVFTDTGSLSEIAVTVVYTYPTDQASEKPLPRYYSITPTGSGPYAARLTLCYTDDEFEQSDVVNEGELCAYRATTSGWVAYPSIVDTAGNLVTAREVTEFSIWALGGPGGEPTAVELAYFAATPNAGRILLEWETSSEIDNLGFNVYRAVDLIGEPVRLNEILIPSQNPGSPVGGSYQFSDSSVEPRVTYNYWLETVDIYGIAERHGPVSATLPWFRFYVPVVWQ